MRRGWPCVRDGFTLLEVLVSIALVALVYATAYGLLRAVQRASDYVGAGQGRARAARVVLDRLEQELGGAILVRRPQGSDPLGHPWVFYGENSALEGNDADRVLFVTQTPLRAPGEGANRGLRLVSYGLETNGDGRAVLARGEAPLSEQLTKEIDLADAQPVADDVYRFALSYLDGPGSVEAWDSTGVEHADDTPEAVQVELQLWERDVSGELVPGAPVTRTIELPTRPEYLDPLARGTACASGISVRECMGQWTPALAQLAEDAQAHFRRLFETVREACWNSENPSAELVELQRQLRNLQAMDSELEVGDCPVAEPRPTEKGSRRVPQGDG